jgi:hypothetical protein
MKPIAPMLRRDSVTLFLAGIAILATTTIAQTVRLRYLEQRHHAMLHDFGKARTEMQNKVDELAAGCATPAGS